MPLKTKLYGKHIALTGGRNMADFAGYMMPLWYSSIKAEHEAVRNSAGIFDCTHMGVLDFTGPTAAEFLNLLTANNINNLSDGQAQYSFMPDTEGRAIDDLIVYRESSERFLMVVNAANDTNVQAHLAKAADLLAGRLDTLPTVRDLRADVSGSDRCLVMPVQGVDSQKIIAGLISDAEQKAKFQSLGSFEFCKIDILGGSVYVCSTGYTGSKVGYEFLVHPDICGDLWDAVIAAGAVPCGLGSRDSLRIEAGLPLYGHELEGEHAISPFQAGYGWAVDLNKEWFVGCEGFRKRAENFEMKIYRLELDGSRGVRPVRENDGILTEDGICVGAILSSVKIEDKQIALALAQVGALKAGDVVGGYYVARNDRHIKQGRVAKCIVGDKYEPDLSGVTTKRFMKY